jgi:NAD(P)-dependent dehydrogenase (short-subunit alcohol dehydrogenase family)
MSSAPRPDLQFQVDRAVIVETHNRRTEMLLANKNAVIYGAGGAIGAAVASAFAREGANVFLTGRNLAALDAVAKEIAAADGTAETAGVDALDEQAVERHADAVVAKTGSLDISFNAIAVPQQGIQGTPLVELSAATFSLPVATHTTSHFLTARAAARRMLTQGSGVILTLTATPARLAAPLVGGMAPAWAGVEALTRSLSAELGPHGIRAVCLRPDAIPETATIDVVFGQHAKTLGIPAAEFLAMAEGLTHRRRLPTLAEVANAAAFVASDQASAMTGTVVNLSGGTLVD